MPFVLAVVPNKMQPRFTRFYGGAVLVVRTTGVGVVAEESAKVRYAKYAGTPSVLMGVAGSNTHPGTSYVLFSFLLSVRTERQIPTR